MCVSLCICGCVCVYCICLLCIPWHILDAYPQFLSPLCSFARSPCHAACGIKLFYGTHSGCDDKSASICHIARARATPQPPPPPQLAYCIIYLNLPGGWGSLGGVVPLAEASFMSILWAVSCGEWLKPDLALITRSRGRGREREGERRVPLRLPGFALLQFN